MTVVAITGASSGIGAATARLLAARGDTLVLGARRTELDGSIDDPVLRAQIRRGVDDFGLSPDAVARAIAFAIEQPPDVEIGEITIRPTVQS